MAVRIALLGLMATVLLVTVRELRTEWGVLLRIGAGAVLLVLVISPLARVVAELTQLASLARIRGVYLGLLLKVIGIAYLTTFAAQMAYDTGEAGIGWRIEVAGKIVILTLAVPLIVAITATVLKMIPS